jgi:malate dehydrogenase (oxaloacetate-decarboxylating)(NADP+)
MKLHNHFGMMMVREGDADGLVSGLTQHYPDTVRPALQIVGKREGVNKIAGMYMVVLKNQTLFIADATVNIEPTATELAEIAMLAAERVKEFDVEPRIAMLSFSSFGSSKHPLAQKVRDAVKIVRAKAPSLKIDGEMSADNALVPELLNELYPFNVLKEKANVLIFPDLTSANIAYKLLARLSGATAIGPILLGIKRPVYLLVPGNDTNDIVNATAMAVFEAQENRGKRSPVADEFFVNAH